MTPFSQKKALQSVSLLRVLLSPPQAHVFVVKMFGPVPELMERRRRGRLGMTHGGAFHPSSSSSSTHEVSVPRTQR